MARRSRSWYQCESRKEDNLHGIQTCTLQEVRTDREVVHDHDVARSKCRREMSCDPAPKEFAVGRAVNPPRRGQSPHMQGRQECGCLPVTVRDIADQSCPCQRPSARTTTYSSSPTFRRATRALGIEAWLPQLPRSATLCHVGLPLLPGSQGFFQGHSHHLQRATQRAVAQRRRQLRLEFIQREVGGCGDCVADAVGFRIAPGGTATSQL